MFSITNAGKKHYVEDQIKVFCAAAVMEQQVEKINLMFISMESKNLSGRIEK